MSTLTVAATVEASNEPPRVRLDVTDIGSPNLFAATVTRLDPDGRYVPVRTPSGGPLTLSTSGANRVGIVYDYEMPYGDPIQYSTSEDTSANSGEVVVLTDDVWLIHPGIPDISVLIELAINSLDDEDHPVREGKFSPMGRENLIVVTEGTRSGIESEIIVATDTLAQAQAIRTLISDAGVLLFNPPASMGLGFERAYIAVSNVTISRPSSIGSDPHRLVRMPFSVVDRPAGGSAAERSYADLFDYPTYADLAAAYPTYFDLLAGP